MELTAALQQKLAELYDTTPEAVHGVSLGHKYSGGQDTGKISIVFFVDEKKLQAEIPPDERLPGSLIIDGALVETDVQQVIRAEFVSCYAAGDPEIQRLQPVQSGAAMLVPMRGGQEIIQFPTGWTAAQGGGWNISLGTLGFFAVDNLDNKIVGVTNSHVIINKRVLCSERAVDTYNITDPLTWPPAGSSYAPGALSADGANPLQLLAPAIKRYAPVTGPGVNYSDVALLQVSSNYLDANSYKIWAPLGQDPFTSFLPFASTAEINALLATNPRCYSTGRTTGPKGFENTAACRLRVTNVGATVSVNDPDLGVTSWGDTLVYAYEDGSANPNAGGDSGSALLALISGVYKIIGLVFAGNGSVGVASRIDRVAQEMNIRAWDGTGVLGVLPAPARMTVLKNDARAGSASFVQNGVTYWQSGFTPTP